MNRRLLTQMAVMAVLTSVLCAGCTTGKTGKKSEDFFTSGSREADQRASQHMARSEQLAGTGDKPNAKEKPAPKHGEGPAHAEDKTTLFERLGGTTGITNIVSDFLARVLEDPRVNWQRKGVKPGKLFSKPNPDGIWQATPQNVSALEKHMAQFLSLATGGPTAYDGKEMRSAHALMRISNPEFDAVIGDLKATLDKLQVPDREQKELLAIFESTRPQIVTER